MQQEDQQLIGIKRAMQILGISQSTIRRWMTARRIPYYRFGGKYKFIESELKEFIYKHRFSK